MVLVNTSVKTEHVSRFNAETTITALLMKSAPIRTNHATKLSAKVIKCVKIKPFPVTLTLTTVPRVSANVSTTNAKF